MHHRPVTILIGLFLAFAVTLTTAAQALQLPSVLSDHMVLQRDAGVPVWGWATPGAEVTVRFKGQTLTAKADADGSWRVDLAPLEASAEPAELEVASEDQRLVVKDVLVGEVWLCSGQSNMEWPVSRTDHAEQEIADANWPMIRHISSGHVQNMLPQRDIEAAWTVCSPETVAGYTAVGYFFGRRLHQELGVPIGLINCSWGGTRIEPWTPLEGFAAVPETREIYDATKTRIPGSDAYQSEATRYVESMTQWLASANSSLENHATLDEPPLFPEAIKPYGSHQSPTVLYNAMMAPFVPFSIRGSIWYQGESNHGEGMTYVDKTKAMLAGWRQWWEKQDLPFYFVQIAPFQYGSENPTVLPRFWEAQARIVDAVPYTAMVVIHDIGNLNNIHPSNKQDVGLRLANVALHRDYGFDQIVDTGPTFREMSVEGNRLLLKFDHVAEGLASRDSQPLNHFEIAGEAQPWTDATAEVVAPDTLAVSAPGIETPVAVRFAWHKLAEPNLMNSAGLPAVPFRAGEAPDLDTLTMNVPEAEEYQLLYELDLKQLGRDITYDTDLHESIAGPVERVAYFLELGTDDGPTDWVFVAMDAFTPDVTKLGIPTVNSGVKFQQPVQNLVVRSNVQGLPNSDGLAGNIEFWPNNYAANNSAKVPDAQNNAYDTGDQPREPADGYGSMQVHLAKPSTTVFAINHWVVGNQADLGIGTNKGDGNPDWTFTKTGAQYTVKRLKVLVK